MAQKRSHDSITLPSSTQSYTDTHENDNENGIYESSPIHDRNSSFTAIFSTNQMYLADPKKLQAYPPFKSAMHRILAWRRTSNQTALAFSSSASQPMARSNDTGTPADTQAAGKKVYMTRSDEDGERYAGRKLEKLLDDLQVEGVLVVARWYGGVLLGPIRFEHILNVAREAISLSHGNGSENHVKRIKIESEIEHKIDEAKEKERLMRILIERDSSVLVLRGLLNEKGELLKSLELDLRRVEEKDDKNDRIDGHKVEDTEDYANGKTSETMSSQTKSSPASTASSPSTKVNYAEFPLQRLKQLEKARDASLGWILKQIDALEVKIKDAELEIAKLKADQT